MVVGSFIQGFAQDRESFLAYGSRAVLILA
jgi:hypothetical protein